MGWDLGRPTTSAIELGKVSNNVREA